MTNTKDFFDTFIRPHLHQTPDLELLARQIVEGFIIGLHKSPFHGFSVEFAEHRLYNNGDNLKHVDWKVFGRHDKMFTKRYEEETNLRCYLALDISSSMYYKGDSSHSKIQSAVIHTATVIELMSQQMDAFGLALFDEHIQTLTPAQSNNRHKRELFRFLEKYWLKDVSKETSKQTHLATSLHELAERIHRRSLIIVMTDLYDTLNNPETIIDALHHLKHNKHEVIFFLIGEKKSEWEFDLPQQPIELIDLETQSSIKMHPMEYKELYTNKMKDFKNFWKNKMEELNIDLVTVDINDPPHIILRNYLIKRMKMM